MSGGFPSIQEKFLCPLLPPNSATCNNFSMHNFVSLQVIKFHVCRNQSSFSLDYHGLHWWYKRWCNLLNSPRSALMEKINRHQFGSPDINRWLFLALPTPYP
jgi:hypothetical protein